MTRTIPATTSGIRCTRLASACWNWTPGGVGERLTVIPMPRTASYSLATLPFPLVFHHPDCAYFTADEGESGAAA